MFLETAQSPKQTFELQYNLVVYSAETSQVSDSFMNFSNKSPWRRANSNWNMRRSSPLSSLDAGTALL